MMKLSQTQILIIIIVIVIVILTIVLLYIKQNKSKEQFEEPSTTTSITNPSTTTSITNPSTTQSLNCNDITRDNECSGVCKFLFADSLSADFMNGNLQGMYQEVNVPDMETRCFNKADLANINPSVYCRMHNSSSCLKDTDGRCFIDNDKCKSINLELNGSCSGRCGIASVEGQTCSCSINCKDSNNCCSDYDEKCEKVSAQQTMYDYSNLNLLTYQQYADY